MYQNKITLQLNCDGDDDDDDCLFSLLAVETELQGGSIMALLMEASNRL